MKNEVLGRLTDRVDELFLTFQAELNIESGDIEPLQLIELDRLTEQLAEHITKVLEYQKGGF